MSQEFRFIVRIAGRDLQGSKKLSSALADIKGVGYKLGSYILGTLRIDPKARLGTLSDSQLAEIEKGVKNVAQLNLFPYLLNRQKDLETGTNMHLIGSDLDFAIKNDKEREKNVQSWRGIRHSLGLKVRGQRTRTTGRKGRTIGVRKIALVRPGGPAQTPAAAPAAPATPAEKK